MSEQRMTVQEVLDAIDREWTRLTSAIDRLGANALTVPVTEEGWTAKDVMAHLIHWAGQVAFALGAALSPPEYVTQKRGRTPTGDDWNALAVAFYNDRSLGEVRHELERLADVIEERVRLRTDEQMSATDAVPRAGQLPLWQFIGADTFLHWPVHAEAIERAAVGPP